MDESRTSSVSPTCRRAIWRQLVMQRLLDQYVRRAGQLTVSGQHHNDSDLIFKASEHFGHTCAMAHESYEAID